MRPEVFRDHELQGDAYAARRPIMKTIVTLWSVLLAFGISSAVGIIFGLYPANAEA